MTTWVIISWIFVAVFTAVNIFVFIKLKKASEQMMKMAFPGSKNMGEAMNQMQGMLKGMGGMGGKGMGGMGNMGGRGGNMNPQMKAAMDMLAQMQKGGGGKPRR